MKSYYLLISIPLAILLVVTATSGCLGGAPATSGNVSPTTVPTLNIPAGVTYGKTASTANQTSNGYILKGTGAEGSYLNGNYSVPLFLNAGITHFNFTLDTLNAGKFYRFQLYNMIYIMPDPSHTPTTGKGWVTLLAGHQASEPAITEFNVTYTIPYNGYYEIDVYYPGTWQIEITQ
jgi:hypothetical protein